MSSFLKYTFIKIVLWAIFFTLFYDLFKYMFHFFGLEGIAVRMYLAYFSLILLIIAISPY